MENSPDPTEAPSGMPDDEAESEPAPLGTPDPEHTPDTGEEAMPGIASDGEPPTSG